MNFIKLRIILAVIKVYPIWLIEGLIKMIKKIMLNILPKIFFVALVTEKSAFIKNVTFEWTKYHDPPAGVLSCWDDENVYLPKNIISDMTFWFRYLYEANILNEKNSRSISLSSLMAIKDFDHIIIDYEGNEGKLIKMIIKPNGGSFYYLNEKLETTKVANFDNILLS
jgi:hypothetical protein